VIKPVEEGAGPAFPQNGEAAAISRYAAPKESPCGAAAPKESPCGAAAPKESPSGAAAPKESPCGAGAEHGSKEMETASNIPAQDGRGGGLSIARCFRVNYRL
jgi:hypothetical protein